MGTYSEKKIAAITRTAMAAEVTGWAATGDLELLELAGGWVIVSLSSRDSLSV